jgi:predicted nucleotidyltransferase component of viral defense system
VLDQNEIAAEKVRCILTREKARDVYDLWFLLKRGVKIDTPQVNRKCKIYGVTYDRDEFIEKLNEKRGMWTRDLKSFIIGSLPEFDNAAKEIETNT